MNDSNTEGALLGPSPQAVSEPVDKPWERDHRLPGIRMPNRQEIEDSWVNDSWVFSEPPRAVPLTSDVSDEEPPRRVIVVGSEDWEYPEMIGNLLLRWWVEAGRPQMRLVVADSKIGMAAVNLLNREMGHTHEVHLLPESRFPLRKLMRVMTADEFDHVIVVRWGDDPYVEEWIEYLKELIMTRPSDKPLFTTAIASIEFPL